MRKISMRLRSKFILAIGAILAASYGLLLVYTSILQNRLVIGQARQEARMLRQQILLTRQWVADHRGLFIVKTKKDHANPFLPDPILQTRDGTILVKRNPAMVTRELSEYASRSGFCWFRVTSLRPINPANAPDPFERSSLQLLEEGVPEIIKIIEGDNGRILRYVTPLQVKSSCLSCHAEQGYRIGDIRGALSISIPINWADEAIRHNNQSIIIFGLLSVCSVAMVLYLLFNNLVVRPINQLADAMDDFPEKDPDTFKLPDTNDEIGFLSRRFVNLCERHKRSQEALEQARKQAFRSEKLAALGQLTAGIAHEINNPLGGMLNCIRTIREEPDNRELHDRYLPLIDKGLHRIEHTMRQLLNYGRSEPLQLMRASIDEIIRECLELLEYKLKNINVELDLQLDEAYCIDTEAAKQIVMNICLNAIQAMRDGGTLKITTYRTDDDLVLVFTDTGSGIPGEIIDKIFDPFFTTKEVGEGTGLGLAVTDSLVQQLGGHIEVESEPGRGSRFIIYLPIKLSCPRPGEHQSKSQET